MSHMSKDRSDEQNGEASTDGSSENGGSPQTHGDEVAPDKLSRDLAAFYDDLANEPMPQRLVELLKKIDSNDNDK